MMIFDSGLLFWATLYITKVVTGYKLVVLKTVSFFCCCSAKTLSLCVTICRPYSWTRISWWWATIVEGFVSYWIQVAKT